MNASAKRSLSRRNPLPTLFGDRQFNISSGKVAIITTSRLFEYRGVDRRALTPAKTAKGARNSLARLPEEGQGLERQRRPIRRASG
jgi:hypothetical protein